MAFYRYIPLSVLGFYRQTSDILELVVYEGYPCDGFLQIYIFLSLSWSSTDERTCGDLKKQTTDILVCVVFYIAIPTTHVRYYNDVLRSERQISFLRPMICACAVLAR